MTSCRVLTNHLVTELGLPEVEKG